MRHLMKAVCDEYSPATGGKKTARIARKMSEPHMAVMVENRYSIDQPPDHASVHCKILVGILRCRD